MANQEVNLFAIQMRPSGLTTPPAHSSKNFLANLFSIFLTGRYLRFSKISGLHTLSEMQKLRIQSFDGKKPSVSDNYG